MVNLAFRADINSPRRLMHQQQARLGSQVPGKDDLLLIPAAQGADPLIDGAKFHLQSPQVPIGKALKKRATQYPRATDLIEVRSRDVVQDAQDLKCACPAPIRGNQDKPAPDHMRWRAKPGWSPIDQQLAA